MSVLILAHAAATRQACVCVCCVWARAARDMAEEIPRLERETEAILRLTSRVVSCALMPVLAAPTGVPH